MLSPHAVPLRERSHQRGFRLRRALASGRGQRALQLPALSPLYRTLELKTIAHTYPTKGRHTIAVKVIDIFGNDTMTLIPVTVG